MNELNQMPIKNFLITEFCVKRSTNSLKGKNILNLSLLKYCLLSHFSGDIKRTECNNKIFNSQQNGHLKLRYLKMFFFS